jgi:hypothetical protein
MKMRAYLLPGLIIACSIGVAGCSAFQLHKAASVTQQAQDIASPTPLSNAAATQPAVTAIRPIVQAVGQTAPDGQAILGLVSGLVGIVFGGLQLALKSRSDSRHQAALAALANANPDTVKTMPPSIQATVASAREKIRRVTS